MFVRVLFIDHDNVTNQKLDDVYTRQKFDLIGCILTWLVMLKGRYTLSVNTKPVGASCRY